MMRVYKKVAVPVAEGDLEALIGNATHIFIPTDKEVVKRSDFEKEMGENPEVYDTGETFVVMEDKPVEYGIKKTSFTKMVRVGGTRKPRSKKAAE